MVTAEEFTKLIFDRIAPSEKTEKNKENINLAIGLTVDTLRNLRFRIRNVKILVVIFPHEKLTKSALENLREDFSVDFPSSTIYEIEQDTYGHFFEENKIGIIVPENDVEGVKDYFRDYIIDEKYNLYISEEIN